MFKKQEIGINDIAIIDIGSYKIKVAKVKFKKDEIGITGYAEKRQEQDIIINGEIKDLKGLCDNIKIALNKVDSQNDIKKVIINAITPNVFLNTHNVSVKRDKVDEKIKKGEIFSVIKKKETECLEKSLKNIRLKSGYEKNDLKILLSNINNIFIDGKKVMDLFGRKGEKVDMSITNIFIPVGNYEIFDDIGKGIGKEIISIVPEEYSIVKLFEAKNDVVVINIGNVNTFISVKKRDEIVGTTKINIGMNDLFKKIKEKKIIPTEKIIKNLEIDFKKEKQIFLETLGDCIVVGLQEILKKKVCPNKFYITGGGGKAKFIKDFLADIDFLGNSIKMTKTIKFIDTDFNLDSLEKDKIGMDNKNLLSMIFIAYNIFYDEKTIVKDILMDIVNEIV